MKKQYLLFSFIILVFGTQLSAQTLKNIYRHNQPVLQIPTHLIDKVETVDVGGIKHLQITSLVGELTQIPISEIDSITHQLDSVNPDQLGNLRTASVMGIVRDTGNAPVNNAVVRSPFGGEETHTDANGVFFLNDIVVYDKLAYITIDKSGFHRGSRSFLPLIQGSNLVNIQLLPMTLSGFFNSGTGGQVSSGSVQLNFPANVFMQNGQPYNGQVMVYAAALDPSSAEMFDQMPGELLGGMNDSLRLLRSFGMAAVELRDANFQSLQLKPGVAIGMSFTIPSSLIDDAPETIDWWSFDEVLGYWKHEGVAHKQGDFYLGYATHFSWWNCDVPSNFNYIYGTVTTPDGAPVSNAKVDLGIASIGATATYTNAQGEFSGFVPQNAVLSFNIYLNCHATGDWVLAHTEELISGEESIIDTYVVTLNEFYPISGTIVNCEGQPIQSGYIKLGLAITISNNGAFNIQTCQTGSYSFRAFNTGNLDILSVSDIITVQVDSDGTDVGQVIACSSTSGAVSDIDGNVYQTTLIGNQWWMAENLKTTRFSDGTELLSDSFTWTQYGIPVFRFYENDSTIASIYGNLYNWFTATDPRNVCPSGWHVPSNIEWEELIDFLGGEEVAGGRMKSSLLWEAPNVGGPHDSGFNALPGGYCNSSQFFIELNFGGFWWSTSESTTMQNAVVSRYMNTLSARCMSYSNYPYFGYSIRCVKNE